MHRRDVHIPEPCHVSWETLEVRGPQHRHCAHCQHAVIDLSSMTEEGARRFLNAREDRDLCVSYLVDDSGAIAFVPRNRPPSSAPAVIGVALALAACGNRQTAASGVEGAPSATAPLESAEALPTAIPSPSASALAVDASSEAQLDPADATPKIACASAKTVSPHRSQPSQLMRTAGAPMRVSPPATSATRATHPF